MASKFQVDTEELERRKAGESSSRFQVDTGARFEIDTEELERRNMASKFQVDVAASASQDRVSNPVKQALAGFTDIVTGIPALAGMVGAGTQAGFNTLIGDEDFLQNWEAALSDEGIDQTLFELGMSGRENVNEFFGIEEPISTEDQLARLAGGFIPIPGITVAANASRLAKLLSTTANVLTPAVRMGKKGSRFDKGFAARGATQLGIGTALEQGIRALQDNPNFPLVFSEQALSGIPASQSLISDVTSKFEFDPDYVSPGVEELREQDVKSQKADDWETTKSWGKVALLAIGAYAGVKFSNRMMRAAAAARSPLGEPEVVHGKLSQFVEDIDPARAVLHPITHAPQYINGMPGILRQGGKDLFKYIGEAHVDASKALYNSFIERGFPHTVAEEMVQNSHTDTLNMAQRIIDSGEFGQGTNIKTHSIIDLEIERQALGKDQLTFDQAMLARTILATGADDASPNALWKTGQTTDELKAMMDAGLTNTAIKRLMYKHSDVYDAVLRYQKARRLITQDEVIAFRGKFTMGGKLSYMPLYSSTRQGFLKKLGRAFGVHTDKAKELDEMAKHALAGEFHTRGLEGITSPLGPSQALRQYVIHAVDNANRSAYHIQALQNLSGIRIIGDKVTRFTLDPEGKKIYAKVVKQDQTARGTTYIGRGEITDQTERINITVSKDAPKRFSDMSVNDLKAQLDSGELMTVQHEGKLYAFHVPDKGIRAALDMNPQLSAGLHFMNHYKSLFTRLTTGNLSVFAPVSHMFSAQQVALATAGREGLLAGLGSVKHSLKGSAALFMDSTSKELSQYLAMRLATHTGIAKFAPDFAMQMQKSLARVFRNSLANDVRGETGRIASSLQAETFSGSVADFSKTVGPQFAKFYGSDQMGLVWRMWKGWNTALHEGPAYGAMLKRLGQETIDAKKAGKAIDPKLIREAVDYSKTVAGDMRRMGASAMAKRFNASVPFSAAMIQSWNALGSAAIHGGTLTKNMQSFSRFSAGVGALIGLPTITEMVHAYNLDTMTNDDGTPLTFTDPDNPNKQWTYNDYYWNGYTTQQRADNMIFMVPGEPPWEAIVMPISPEFGLFRGAIMETMDAVFNFSNVGAIETADAGHDKVGRDQFIASIARVADIPLPPLAAAIFSSVGADVRLGLSFEEQHDPSDPGRGVSFIRNVPIGQGERVTRRSGRSKFAQSELDTTTVSMIQDIFGAGGSLYVAVYEAFNASDKVTGGDIFEGVAVGAEAFGDGLRRQARWTQPLWGKVLRPSAGGEVAANLFSRRKALEALKTDFGSYFRGGQAGPNLTVNQGNMDIPPDDPINLELSAYAGDILSNIGKLDSQISDHRRQIQLLGNSVNTMSRRALNNKMDYYALAIQDIKAQQLGVLLDFEELVSDKLTTRYGREIDINLSTFKPRANLVGDSIFQGFLKPRQTSQ